MQQVAVQGPRASEEIIEALQRLDADKAVDVIIIARGGGSVEDLLPFSDEDLVRAVAGCVTPVIQYWSGMSRMCRCWTSSPMSAPRRRRMRPGARVPGVAEQLRAESAQLRGPSAQVAGLCGSTGEASWLTAISSRPAMASPLLEMDRRQEQVLALAERARLAIAAGLDRAGDDLVHIRARLVALSPAATLRRGYSIVQQADATVVLSADQVTDGEILTVRFAADQLTVTAATGQVTAQ